MITSPARPPRATRRAWAGLGLLVVPVLMTAIDMTVLFLAIPRIAAALDPTGTQQLWILHVGDLVGAGLVLTAGSVVDRLGPRRMMAIGLLAYAAASLTASLADDVGTLILARLLLGAGAVSLLPAAMALARRMFPDEQQLATAVGLLMASFSAGMALGPLVGGALLEYFWWGAVFLVNVPVALLVLAGMPLLPAVEGTGRGRVDLPSVALSLGGLALTVYAGQELAASGGRTPEHGVLVLAGLALLAWFVVRQRRLDDPLLDVDLFRAPAFSLSLLAILLVIVADAGAELQLAQHLQVVSGLSPLHAGAALAVPAVVGIVATALAPQLLRRWCAPGIIAAGGVVAVLSAAATAVLATEAGSSPAWLLVAASGVALGISPVFALGTVLVLDAAPLEQAGTASASQDVSGSLGNTLGLALGGSVAYLVYSSSVDDALPSGTPPEIAEGSRQSVGRALELAAGLESGAVLRETATLAFAQATGAAYVVAAVGFALTTGVAVLLRHLVRPEARA